MPAWLSMSSMFVFGGLFVTAFAAKELERRGRINRVEREQVTLISLTVLFCLGLLHAVVAVAIERDKSSALMFGLVLVICFCTMLLTNTRIERAKNGH